METNLEDAEKCKKKLTVTVQSKTANDDYKKVIRKYSKHVDIPGFRKGKAPISMIEKMYGEQLLTGFIEEYAQKYYAKAMKQEEENNISPVSEGVLEDWSWEDRKELELIYTFEVRPEIELENYDNLEIEYKPKEVTEEMIDAKIKEFQKTVASTEEKDAPIEKGDKIFYVFTKFEDEEIKQEDEPKEYPYEVGSNQFGVEFDGNLIGKKRGEIVYTQISLPPSKPTAEPYPKEVELKIMSVKSIILPIPDDEFAKDVGDYKTLKELKDDIIKDLEASVEKENTDTINRLISQKLIDDNEFEVPQKQVDTFLENMLKQQDAQNLESEQMEQMKQIYGQIATMQIKNFYIKEKLRELEEIEISEDDIETEIKLQADKMNMEVDKYKKMYKKTTEGEHFKNDIIDNKIMEKIRKTVKMVEPKETSDVKKEENGKTNNDENKEK